MNKNINQITELVDFIPAPLGEKCIECDDVAIGDVEWWNYGDNWDFGSTTFYCEKHLLEKYKDYE